MTVTALKPKLAPMALPELVQAAAKVLPLPPPAPRSRWVGKATMLFLNNVLPPVLVITCLLAIWQSALSGGWGRIAVAAGDMGAERLSDP